MSQNEKHYFVHASAFVDEPCQIGEGTKIWHYCHVCSGATIGAGCNFGQNVFVAPSVVMGDNIKIQNNVSVYDGVVLEDDVFLGPSCVLTNISNPRSQVIRRGVYEKTLIKKGATVGANATIVCGTTVGRYALIAAGAVVTADVADYALVMGVPGKQTGWVSRHGIPLTDPDQEGVMTCPESGLRYQLQDDRLRCLDIDEEEQLPKQHSIGAKEYRNYKPRKN